MIIHVGDCLSILPTLADSSVDAIVTDPPYGLSFMGKRWDYDVPSTAIWAECLRVLKPGGHLLAFAGTRTQRRMAVRIEDAGFEIRDMIAWVYSTGFPKSHNLDNLRGDKLCGCSVPYTHDRAPSKPEHDVRSVQHADVPSAECVSQGFGPVLQQGVQEPRAPASGREQLPTAEIWCGQSSLEGRCDAAQPARELSAGSIRSVPAESSIDGAPGMARVKESGCAVCGAGGFVDAHHIQQGCHYTTVGLCPECHRGPMGIHGDKTMWRTHKINEMEALNETLRRVYG